jgi:hypothetical protein
MTWMERHFGGHFRLGPLTQYGYNAMHFATNLRTPWGYLCFKPPTYCFGRWWRWYVYLSDDATPQGAKWQLGWALYD